MFRKTKEIEHDIDIKRQGAEYRTKIYFNGTVYKSMGEVESILKENEHDLLNTNFELNSQKEIDKFMKNVSLGRHNYISYAVALGYKSINYADPWTGNTALHIAVKNGHFLVVEELVKYKANPNVKNKLG